MIALDTSSLIAYFSGDSGEDVGLVETALVQKQAVLPPAVVSELLSDPKLPLHVAKLIRDVPQLSLTEGYWERVGWLRSRVIAKGLKARLADALIAQSCLDHRVSLVTRDSDFRHFEKTSGLKLLGESPFVKTTVDQ